MGIEPRGSKYDFEVVLSYIESICWRQKRIETKSGKRMETKQTLE